MKKTIGVLLLCFMILPLPVFATESTTEAVNSKTVESTESENTAAEGNNTENTKKENTKTETTKTENTKSKTDTTKTQDSKSTEDNKTTTESKTSNTKSDNKSSKDSSTDNSESKEDSTTTYKAETAYYNPEIGTTLRYPLAAKAVVSCYFQEHDSLHPSGHSGVDLAISTGTHVLAAESGVVTRASWYGGYGNCVDIEHKNGLVTRYGHMSEINVKVGDKVIRGQLIGKVGSTGRSTGPHLHFEVIYNGKTVNGLNYIEEVATDTETPYCNVKFLFVDKTSTATTYKDNIYFQLTERLIPIVKDNKTLVDISKYYNNGLINSEPLVINTKETVTLKDNVLIIDGDKPQSEIQLVIPSNNIQKNSVTVSLYKNGYNFDKFIERFSPLFDMELDIKGDITKENIKVTIDNKVLDPAYYTYENSILSIMYSCLNVTNIDIDILDEPQKFESNTLADSINNITTWIKADDIDFISLNSTPICYVADSILPDIDTEYDLLPYNRYNYEYEDGIIKSNILVDNTLSSAFISLPIELLSTDVELSSEVDPQTHYGTEPESQTFTYKGKEYNLFIYGENLLPDTDNITPGLYPVEFKILDYIQKDKYTYIICTYNVEGIGGYFGLQVKN